MNYKTRVRVVITDDSHRNMMQPILEQLRHAGLIVVHRNNDEMYLFDMIPPSTLPRSTKAQVEWAHANAERMQSFGYSAVAAPPWEE
jgi:hypothetical protein